MATKAKGTILKEQITFDFFDKMNIEKPKKEVENKIVKEKPKAEKVKVVKQFIFRKQCNIKPNHIKLNRKVRRIL